MRTETVRKACGWLLLACVVAFVGAWQLRARDAMKNWDPDLARKANRPIPVRTVKVEKRDLEETIGGTCVTLPAQTAQIMLPTTSSQVADREVKFVGRHPGADVKQGELLIEFDPTLFAHVVRQREAMVEKSKVEHETMVKLFEKHAVAGLEVITAKVALETAELELALAKRDLELCTVKSPIDGTVEQVNVVPQMRIGGGVMLAVVHQLDPIFVQMDFPMERIDSLKVGQPVEVVLDAFPQDTFNGKVSQISPVVSTKTRVLPVIVEVANPQHRIRAGISGFSRLKSVKPGMTAVPNVAVIKQQQKAMVVCVEDSRAKIREVHTGPMTEAGQVQILDGLKSGDEVVVFGQDALQENDFVNVDWHKWTRRQDVGKETP